MNRTISEIMQTHVEYVTPDTPLREIGRIIFGYNINGVPVCDGKKVVGFITEKDILSQFYPDQAPEKTNHKDVDDVLGKTAKDIMNPNPVLIESNVSLHEARNIMFKQKISRLPVVTAEGELLGIVSKGDIFRAIVQRELAIGEEEEFYDWLSRNYDSLFNWNKRLSAELPSLVKLFKRRKVKKIVDIASSTGAHSLALSRKGFETYGLEASVLINKIAEEKRSKLGPDQQSKVTFISGSYDESIEKLPDDMDAAIFMGDALSHVLITDPEILKNLSKKLNKKSSTLVFQMLNYNKVLQLRSGLRDFLVRKPNPNYEKDHIYVGFYSKTKEKGHLQYSVAIFDLVGGRWVCKSINNTQILNLGEKEITAILKKLGFSQISFYGSTSSGSISEYYTEYGKLSFTKPFDSEESDWMVVVAEK